MRAFVKIKGFDTFFLCSFSVRVSLKGNRIARLVSCVPVSRSTYYRAPRSARCIVNCSWERLTPGRDFHALGNAHLMQVLEG